MKSPRPVYKILHLTTHLNIGGVTSHLLVLGKAMTARGHAVAIATSTGTMAGAFKDAGIGVHEFNIRTKNEFHPKLWVSLPALARLVADEKIDVIHAHSRVTQVLANGLSHWTGVPYVVTAHGFFKTNWGRRVFPAWGHCTVAIGELVAEDLAQTHGVSRERVRVIQNALDLESFQKELLSADAAGTKRSFGIPPHAPVVGSVSRLVADKGHDVLIRAVKRLESSHPDLHVIVLGEGRERPRLEALVRELGLSTRVHWAGATKDVASALVAFDIFAHPATYREGFGLSMAEAMVAGKPVLATTVRAIPSTIRDGENGFLVAPNDADALARGLADLLDHPAKARDAAEKGRQTARVLCSPERMASETEAVYAEVIQHASAKKTA